MGKMGNNIIIDGFLVNKIVIEWGFQILPNSNNRLFDKIMRN